MGYIRVPAYKDDPEQLVRSKYEALIDRKTLEAVQERIDRTMDLFLDREISKAEKERLIERYERQQTELKERIEALRLSKDMQIKDKIDYSVNIIENLGRFFQTASPETKILLLGSIFPEKIEYMTEKIIEPTPTTKCLMLSIRKLITYGAEKKKTLPKNQESPLWGR